MFFSAWRLSIGEFKALDGEVEKRNFIPVREAQEIYRPVGLRETDLGLQYASSEIIADDFKRGMAQLVDRIIEDYLAAANASGRKRDYNRLDKASEYFAKAIPGAATTTLEFP